MIITYLLDSRMLPDPLDDETALSGLPNERIERIRCQKHPDLRKQHLGAGLLLNYGLQQTAGTKSVDIAYNCYGKPFAAQIPFNLSHSGDYIILSIQNSLQEQETAERLHNQTSGSSRCVQSPETKLPTDALLIGCDIEQMKKYNPKVARRFFTNAEYQNLEHAADQNAQAKLFFQYWTRKESVLKLTGLGMALPMDVFDVSTGERAVVDLEKLNAWYEAWKGERPLECRQAFQILQERTLFFKEYCYHNYCITVCSTEEQESIFFPILYIKELSQNNFTEWSKQK